jgi:dTDP-4-amino-4,6-dideoxygalactose transaminase
VNLPLVDLQRQYASIKAEIDGALLDAVSSAEYILGRDVSEFEREFAAYCDVPHCVGVGSGTAALLLILEALGVSEDDEVIAPANTFIASVIPVLKLGARPVLVDCDRETATIDVELAERSITSRTKVLVAVHLYGHPADVDPLRRLARENGIFLVEDACQAHGARYRGERVGGLGDAAAFSFYPGKNLGAYGDAGAVTTRDGALAERIRLLRDLGQERKYQHVVSGWNERLDTLQAAVLRVKLRHLERWNDLRRQHAAMYNAALEEADIVLPTQQVWAEHVWHLYVIRARARDALREILRDEGIATGLHYPLPLHLQPALRDLGYAEGDFPVTEQLASEILSLPMFPELTEEDVERVSSVLASGVCVAEGAPI